MIDYKKAAGEAVNILDLIAKDFEPNEDGVYPSISSKRVEDLHLFADLALNTNPLKLILQSYLDNEKN